MRPHLHALCNNCNLELFFLHLFLDVYLKGELETASETQSKGEEEDEEERVRTKRKMKIYPILVTVGKKLIRNPNTFASLLGIIWSSIHFRWGIHMPEVVNQSIELLSNGGLGMAMFSIGIYVTYTLFKVYFVIIINL